MTYKLTLVAVAALMALSGCVNLTGLSGSSSEFACKAQQGVTCMSVSGVYQNSLRNMLPSQREANKGTDGRSDSGAQRYFQNDDVDVGSPRRRQTLLTGDPLRSAAAVWRVWVAPWQSQKGDLHDQSYFYTVTSPGEWKIGTTRQSIEAEFRPVFISGKPTAAAPSTPATPPVQRSTLLQSGDYSNLGAPGPGPK